VETRPQNGALPVAEPSAPEPRIDSSAPDRSHVGAPAVEEEVARGSLEEELQTTPAPLSIALDPQVEGVQREVSLDGPSVEPQKAVPPTPEDVAMLPEGLSPVVSSEQAPKPPQVVHLPSQEAQEARLQETERELEKVNEKERKEDERLALPSASAPGDLVSSPSSTVGPYSQATPHAPHHSPDTSPDTESFRDRIPPVENGLDSDPAAQQAKEEHERALQRQMQEARERAREGSSPTPEIERQLEDEQAIRLARDGKSRLSESRNTPVAHSVAHSVADATEKIMPEVRLQMPNTEEDRISQGPAADSLPTPTTTAPEPAVPDADTPESQAAKPQEARPIETDHPTPPADIDVEMNDAPPLVQEQSKPLSQPLRSERMITRVSSGAIRQRSVSEIIAEKAAPKTVLTPRSSDLSSASTTPPRRRAQEQKAKEVSTIIFAKQDTSRNSKSLQLYSEEYASLQGVSQDSDRDYLEGLFQYQAHHPPRALPLTELLNSAKKTFSTSGMLAMVRETQNYKILKRVYQLQNANRWSLRQLQKSAEPPRPTSHLDHLLKEMKWMQTDFKEERKWKRALAATFAGWCAEYVNSSPEEQAMARVKARIPQRGRRRSIADEEMHDVPGLSHSGANETESESLVDDEEFLSPYSSNPPAGLFSLGFDDVVMKIDPTPASDAMLQELPTYEPVLEGASDVTPMSFCDPPILPVSKYVTGKLVSEIRGPPRKPSRFEYESEDEPSSPPSRPGTSTEHSMPSTPGRRLFHRHDLAPEMNDVALFNPENKHVRDRLQVAHQFRPPTEFPMPSVSFFENRTSSQWLWEEDQKLRGLVKDFTFNWSLVAQELSLPSMFISGSGRRTPWECFERWVQLEGLPSEMSKTQYFRTYQTRLEQAQRTVTAQHQAQQQLLQQQQQAGQNVSASQLRRRTTQPIRVERRRDNRHLAIIDGMRKLARKRESAAHKQAEGEW
jgi:chromatin modification-related protein VID21